MDEPGFSTDFSQEAAALLQASCIIIWGLGLMGGSLAMALRGKCARLVGIDADPLVVSLAKQREIVDAAYRIEEVFADPAKVLAGANCIVLAAPVCAILATLENLPLLCSDPVVVIDLGSTKARIVEAMAGLPACFDPLGGHPMCGKEKASLEHAEAGIYTRAPFALVALPRTTGHAKEIGEALARAAGAHPLWIDADSHDRWVAATSHAPFLLASALAAATPLEATALVGPGFRSTTRLANSSPRMMADILETNAENVQAAISQFKEQLVLYEDLLKRRDFKGLEDAFAAAGVQYRSLTGQ